MKNKEIEAKYVFTSDTSEKWERSNPVLPQGFKIGDGSSLWTDLPWQGSKVEWGDTNGALIIDGEKRNVYEPQVDNTTIVKNEDGVLSVAEGALIGSKITSSDEDNKIKFYEDGTGEINSVNVQKLFVAERDEFILNCGSASSSSTI